MIFGVAQQEFEIVNADLDDFIAHHNFFRMLKNTACVDSAGRLNRIADGNVTGS